LMCGWSIAFLQRRRGTIHLLLPNDIFTASSPRSSQSPRTGRHSGTSKSAS
jgi:hypothetical protein